MSSWKNTLFQTIDAIKAHGWKRVVWQYNTIDQAKAGTFVGKDYLGNEYYENKNDVVVRDRWVLFSRWNSDASQVPPEWHQWLHRMTDDIPTEKTLPKPAKYNPPAHIENLTGTTAAFKTYSTTVPKISGWTPSVKPRGGDL
ncbi:NADH ubiquinone oxidoreductase subunit NDUFA12-domain-containing protein [Polychytrium aggregatum]|uniref:NADH ubiquinone oxidoreductase subunit NDUFA12-domain-containing protein n=1 Tax=Polychytrium aggregatum TaxID=110093 RepID=UPI0022FECE95|nr:NADH ubiquinone oxidoreductase subunit NDUFA12-domain-containing protein [Polychytrium aggregatum]KAI9193521.1 NADH ubiquinone oxidoreductase subunit NDUFA12-domain-containing protein [Polychytrium aggregatum]